MRRIATAALLAALLPLADPGEAWANNPCTFGLGCPGCCLRSFPRIHQHGPLFNYGPYYGYPPFEPYGPWNAYLMYTGPVPGPGCGHGGCAGPGAYGWIHGGYGYGWGGGNPYPLCPGVHGGGGFHHGYGYGGYDGGCPGGACSASAAGYVYSGNALDRYTGRGEPAASAAYYAETPSVLDAAGVVPAGFGGR